jgi:hypothetical protein
MYVTYEIQLECCETVFSQAFLEGYKYECPT